MAPLDTLFANLRRAGQKAFIPFVTAGDPSLDFTSHLVEELVARGASLVELGIPYSDPIADGPVIQASYTRALHKKIRLESIFKMASRLTPKISAPLVTMVSYAIVYRHGLARYVADAKAAGIAGAIVPDLLIEEADELAALCRQAEFSLVQLITPTTPRERAVKIARSATGFIYYVSVTGITGERTQLPAELVENVNWLRGQTDVPLCIGFGISRPEHVRMLAPVADGLIVGSGIVRRIAEAGEKPGPEIIRDVGDYAAGLMAALNA